MQLLDQRYSDAVKSFQRAITLGDDGTRSFIGMGMAYLHMGQLGPARAAFVEAKSRGAANPQDVDGIIAWIDNRDPGDEPSTSLTVRGRPPVARNLQRLSTGQARPTIWICDQFGPASRSGCPGRRST